MSIRAEYEIRKLPDSYVTKETHYGFEDIPGSRKDRFGREMQRRVEKEVEVRGGWLLIVRGKPGHSIRLQSEEQATALKVALKPRLVDSTTGEEVNEKGIPLTVVAQLAAAESGEYEVGGRVDTDIDVNQGPNLDGELGDEMPRDHIAGEEVVASAIDKLE